MRMSSTEKETEAKPETEATPVKIKKPEKVKRKKVSPQVRKFYSVDGNSVKLIARDCPRCGKGVFLSEHSNRFSCGKCNYTQFKKA